MRSSLLAVGSLSVVGLAGCGLPPSSDGPDAEPTSQTATAIVVVERSAGPGDFVRGDAVVARFVRVRQGTVDDPELRLAGVAQDLPLLGTCSATPSEAPAATARQVELLDVGAVTLDGVEGRSTPLLARAMPDPTGVVSGVFYSARTADAFGAGARLQLRAAGGQDLLDGFTVSVPSPRDLGDVSVASNASGLDVQWGSANDPESHDIVYVDVSASSRLVTRCATLDTGHLLVPASSVGTADEGEVAVHRLHRETFHAKGIDPGEVRFDLARVTTFSR